MWWGVAAALSANVLYSSGFVLEKRALSGIPALSVRRPLRLVRLLLGSPLWIGGSLALAAGFGAQLVVYRTLPMAAAQGLFVSGLVLLLLLSSLILGERLSRRERYATAGILAALLMVVASLRQDADVVGDSASAVSVLALSGVTLLAGFRLYAVAERRTARRQHAAPPTGIAYAVAVGLIYGVSSLAIKGISARLAPDAPLASALSLAATPYPYLLLITGAGGLVLSQTALQRCRASLVVPVCTTTSCLYTATVGTLAFGESLPQDPIRLVLLLAGASLAVSVLLALSLPPAQKSEKPSHEVR
ncbi:hypothetical protein QWM81_20485 [Streptomyces ficellus]|uniref:DMT family transporter n=1 Tax=Streptomyces ficellus TaxID=1977088 RepID=A0ABT7ZBI0_9ACTN|nr:hypothetical protein [Streptomyces ficellus]MDN3296396.1 hypothetical protein [Streptomyces ficellus]